MYQSTAEFISEYGGADIALPKLNTGQYTRGRHLEVVLRLAKSRDGAPIAEVGTALGDTTVKLAQTCPSSEVFTYDIYREAVVKPSPFFNEVPAKHEGGIRILEQAAPVRSRIHQVQEKPDIVRVKILENGPYGMAYIDGEHTWRAVIEDTRVVLRSMSVNGIVAWDDFQQEIPEVMAAINVINIRCGDIITNVHNTRVCFIVLAEGIRERMLEAMEDL